MATINYQTARFEASYGTVAQLPASTTPEVAVAGRSNVGKSSLLNKLFNRKGLVKVSSTPGKTANINFFDVDGIRFVDLPGYGFAKVSQREKQRWADLISGYFAQERSFNLVIALVDIRHDAQKLDHEMVGFLRESELPFVVALTKADKLKKAQQQAAEARVRELCAPYGCRQVFLTSAEKGTGIDALRACLDAAVGETADGL